jgi:periplasmic protein TonB
MSKGKEIVKVESGAANFGECLVEGSAEEKKRGKRARRRAIAISIALQGLGLAALAIAPMLAKPAELTVVSTIPIPPYRNYIEQRHAGERRFVRPVVRSTPIFQPNSIPHQISTVDHSVPPSQPPGFEDLPARPGNDHSPNGLIPLVDPSNQHVAPAPPSDKKRIVMGHIDPAMLMRRVEPLYPPVAKQIRKNGKVELRALIATDGTIQSLQVVSGDPLFVQSALQAVQQWRYKPTLLNGQPVEIDTFITVIYTLNQQ